jgi:chemotaxis protein CheZ
VSPEVSDWQQQPAYLERFAALSSALENNQTDQANRLIEEMASLRESALFQQLGQLTREVHEEISGLSLAPSIIEMAREEASNAHKRLQYVADKTEQATHDTLDATEASLQMVTECDGILQSVRNMLADNSPGTDQQPFSPASLHETLSLIEHGSNQLRAQMTDIIMAQQFQDLVGQTIRQVLQLIEEVELKLVRLVADTGPMHDPATPSAEPGVSAVAPSANATDRVSKQGEVDDILAGLGF